MQRFVPAVALAALSVLVIGETLLQTTRGTTQVPQNISSNQTVPSTTPPTTPVTIPVGPPVVVISPTIDATGTTDVSVKMAAFFASVRDGSVISLKPQGRYRMDQTLVLNGRHNLTVTGNGALFFAVSAGDNRGSNVLIENSSAIVVNNLVVRGANPHAGLVDAAYVPAYEHQHGFELLSVSGVFLLNVTVTDVYGDFVYISKLPNSGWSNGVAVIGSHLARNGRQGISVTAGRNIFIAQNTITDVRATTFDLEPAPQDGVDSVNLSDNVIGSARALFVAADGHGPVNNITVSGNKLTGLALSVWAENSVSGLRNGWKIYGNTSNVKFGTPTGSLMRITGGNAISIHDNTEPFQTGRNMVVAAVTNSCNVVVTNNVRPGSIGEQRALGQC